MLFLLPIFTLILGCHANRLEASESTFVSGTWGLVQNGCVYFNGHSIHLSYGVQPHRCQWVGTGGCLRNQSHHFRQSVCPLLLVFAQLGDRFLFCSEHNPLIVDGHPAWAVELDLNTHESRVLHPLSNTWCASGSFLSNGTLVSTGGSPIRIDTGMCHFQPFCFSPRLISLFRREWLARPPYIYPLHRRNVRRARRPYTNPAFNSQVVSILREILPDSCNFQIQCTTIRYESKMGRLLF